MRFVCLIAMYRRTLLHPILIFIGIALASVLLTGAGSAQMTAPIQPAQAQVSAYVAAQLADDLGPLPLLVVLDDQLDTTAAVAQVAATTAPGESQREARLAAVYTSLVDHAERSQAALVAWLDAQGIPYTRHYLVNLIALQGDAALVQALQQRPEVAAIVGDPLVTGAGIALSDGGRPPASDGGRPPASDGGRPPASDQPSWAEWIETSDAPMTPTTPYGLDLIGAPAVWAQGYRGQGIVVAGQDTGVYWEHEALRDHYRGWDGAGASHTYNWLDAWAGAGGADDCAGAVGPCDDHGHGTHTLGTVVASTGDAVYGVAPDATWIGCRNMLGGIGTPSSYLTCFEFFLAPYPQGGDPFRDGRPDLAPHVINNSWGCPESEGCDPGTLTAAVETVRAAGILVVASTGNLGPGCNSVRDPIAIYDATLSVAAFDAGGNLASFSSRGTVTVDGSGRLKPDLAAPGVGVYSTLRNDRYGYSSGTSMAAPHVAGAAALLWSAASSLAGSPDLTEQILFKSATHVLNANCTGTDTPVSPNPSFGYGRLNVAAAVEMARAPWQVAVQVHDGGDDAPQPGAGVTLTDLVTGYIYSATTGFNGVAYLSPIFHGDYAVTVTSSPNTAVPPTLTLAANGLPVEYTYRENDLAVGVAAKPAVDDTPSAPRPRVLLPFFVVS